MTNSEQRQRKKARRSGVWIMVIAALALEAISCTMYFTSRAAIKKEAAIRAQTELKKAELEIELHTIEMETAAKTLALMAERNVDSPDSIYAATRLAVSTMREYTSVAVAYVPGYFPQKGRYFEVCSTRSRTADNKRDSIYTRQIGSENHDYTQMEWYKNGFVHDSCWWCEPYLDNSGSEAHVVSCSYPVRNKQGKVVAVVCVDMSLSYLQQKLPQYLRVYKNSYFSIRSGNGGDIVRAMDTVPGRKYNVFGEEIDATGWHIEIIIPEDEMFADLNRIGKIVSVLMLLGLALLALMIVYTTRTTRKLFDSMEKNQRIEGELHIASAIQTAMLPKVFPPFSDRLDVNIYGRVTPAKEVGGDLYDFCVRQDKLFFCIGDVSGKGVPASLVMAMTRSLFRGAVAHEDRADVIMGEMNNALAEQNSQNMFLTLFVGVLDCQTGELNYCNAGHNAPIHLRSTIEPLPVVPNLPLGIEPGFVFQAQTLQVHYGDMLFLYTDGLTEAENAEHQQYGEERLMAKGEALMAKGASPREAVDEMQADVERFVDGAEQSDDLTMLVLRYQQPAICMRNDIQQIPTLAEWVEGLDIPTELSMPVNLALEEIVSNVMLYAYPDKSGQVYVEFVRVADRLIFTVTDSGMAFDPTQKEEVDTTLTAEERPIGGLGIHLVRQLMDEVCYQRLDNKNVLTLIKTI